MTCSSCNSEVDDGAAICPHCDAVLDASAFDEPAAKPAPPPKKAAPPPKRAEPRKAAAAPPASRPAAAVAAAAPPKASAAEVIKRRRRRKVVVDYSADRILGDTLDVIQSLLPFDRVALYGAVAMVLTLFFPWRTTQAEGDEIGFSSGWPVAAILVVAGAALFVRTSDDLRGLRADLLALVQVLGGVGAVGYCTWFFFSAIDNHPYRSLLGTTDLKVSSPSWGVVLCALASIVFGTGSLWAWMVEKDG